MIKSKTILLYCLIAFLLVGQGLALAKEKDPNTLVPDFALLSNKNETVRLSDFRGKVVVLNFWASWCPPCRKEMPDFEELHRELEESDEAVLLLLNQVYGQETVKTGQDYLDWNNFTMTNLYDHGLVGIQIFAIPGLPTTVVIDAEGYLSSHVVGGVTKDVVLKMIEEAK